MFPPPRAQPCLFGFVLWVLMSLLVSGIATLREAGLMHDFPGLWLSGSLTFWAVAFPAGLFEASVGRRMVPRLVRTE